MLVSVVVCMIVIVVVVVTMTVVAVTVVAVTVIVVTVIAVTMIDVTVIDGPAAAMARVLHVATSDGQGLPRQGLRCFRADRRCSAARALFRQQLSSLGESPIVVSSLAL